MKTQAYLAFSGNCLEALNFYADCFNAEIKNKQTYKNAKADIPENYRDKLQHAELVGKGIHIMAYDAAPDTPLTQGNNIHLSVDLDQEETTKALYDKLSKDGQIQHKLSETNWNALYARLRDKYGTNWMINCKL